ncbi:dUMP phosphatase [Parashewanella spongiae]|uniref:DUMP phosphatase n=1 Tax=Parashewanella spongiae TaxID=342950 RepID=A0A3A6TSY2_9GAMM|nr:pyrimidine 5'-nucleotidase [Parashewanella spongiae]MCL1078514.1 pyrimidine 5'-nucleotidase [Parashewanella spongiae]RJY14715.1 dUMP phosphatase [Parashewanella spongiae]
MKKYKWVLFDADDTLFDFDAFAGLTVLFSQYQYVFTKQDYQAYQALNKSLWLKYQDNLIDAQTLQIERFKPWEAQFGVSAAKFNAGFLLAMAEVCRPLSGAIELLQYLKNNGTKVGIVTNGFTALQQLRLDKTGINEFVDLLVISEQVGFAKPDRRVFEYTIDKMDDAAFTSVLMVGDNLNTDVQGGFNAGIDTCWYNAKCETNTTNLIPTIEVKSHQQLLALLSTSR